MDHCGFSDSSSDNDEGDEGNTCAKDVHDDWINGQQHQKEDEAQNETQRTQSKPPTQSAKTRKPAYRARHYLAPTSLQDMKNEIGSSVRNTDDHCAALPPPPLQDFTDDSTMSYHRLSGTYKKKRRRSGCHRSNLDISEFVTPSPAKHQWQQYPKITGVSAQVSMGVKLESAPYFEPAKLKLSEIVHQLKNAEYKPEEFVAIRVKLKNPQMTVTVFSNGKMTTQGGKSQHSCVVALRKVARMLQQIPTYTARISHINEPQFYGIQCNAHLSHRVDLQRMTEAFPKRAEYAPDLESAYLKFRDPLKYGDKGSCHVYHSGRITILGCASVSKCIEWMEAMYEHCKDQFVDVTAGDAENSNEHHFADTNIRYELHENEHENENEKNAEADNIQLMMSEMAPPPLL